MSSVGVYVLDARLDNLSSRWDVMSRSSRRTSLEKTLSGFLDSLPYEVNLVSCNPKDVCRFLVWKDTFGRTKVHHTECPYLGSDKSGVVCSCPVRLAASTIEATIFKLKALFKSMGRGSFWDCWSCSGNPAYSVQVGDYLRACQIEQADAHVVKRQSRPFFGGKLKRLTEFFAREISVQGLTFRARFALLRDRAFFLLQVFSGSRAGDLCKLKCNEIHQLPFDEGLLVSQTWGKTLRNGNSNVFVIPRVIDSVLCPVLALEELVLAASSFGVPLSKGYVFRLVREDGSVLAASVGYSTMYQRLKCYLRSIGIDDGETPHSFRSACGVNLLLGGASEEEIMGHIGWRCKETMRYYCRFNALSSKSLAAARLTSVVGSSQLKSQFDRYANPGALPLAFGN